MPRGTPYRPLKFKRVPHPRMTHPCIVPISHKPDSKGYVRVVPRGSKGDRARPLHRIAYERRRGPIPMGFEVDHICRVRGCCHYRHLRILTMSDHKRITASARYADRLETARSHWTYHRSKPAELAELFGVKPRTAEGWISRWKREA